MDQPVITEIIPIPNSGQGDEPITLATVRLVIDHITDRVWFTGTVGWVSQSGTPNVRFTITRTRPTGTEETIFFTDDEADAPDSDNLVTTSFSFVDTTPILTQGPQLVIYRLKAVNFLPGTAAVVSGPIVFTGAEIRANPT